MKCYNIAILPVEWGDYPGFLEACKWKSRGRMKFCFWLYALVTCFKNVVLKDLFSLGCLEGQKKKDQFLYYQNLISSLTSFNLLPSWRSPVDQSWTICVMKYSQHEQAGQESCLYLETLAGLAHLMSIEAGHRSNLAFVNTSTWLKSQWQNLNI